MEHSESLESSESSVSSLKNKKILFCGASGRSGQAAARLALALEAHVLLSDKKARPELEVLSQEGLLPLDHNRISDLRPRQDAKILSQHSPDLLVLAPGLAPQLEIIQAAQRQGLSLLSENDFGFKLLLEIYKQKKKKQPFVIGITGTDGKSTTTALLTELINKSTKLSAVSCGNFGLPLSDLALDAKSNNVFYDVLIVECSSFQLERSQYFHPQIALFLNLARDHSDRYTDLQDYFQTKLQISKLQDEKDILILSEDLKKSVEENWQAQSSKTKFPRLLTLSLKKKESTFYFGNEALVSFSDFKLPGLHNLKNANFALAALEELSLRCPSSVNSKNLKAALVAFRGLAHRLEYVRSLSLSEPYTLEYYNDSKATTVQAVKAALESFAGKHVFLLCGGESKGDDFSVLTALNSSIDLFPFGKAGPEIVKQIRLAKKASILKLHNPSPSLKSAFEQASNVAENHLRSSSPSAFKQGSQEPKNLGASLGDRNESSFVILLSPGCSSFDAYDNYSQRGEHFCRLVHQYVQESKKV